MILVKRTNQNIDGENRDLNPPTLTYLTEQRIKRFMVNIIDRKTKWILYLLRYQVTNESYL